MLPRDRSEPFSWISFDVSSLLPPGWRDDVHQVVTTRTQLHRLQPSSVTSREAADVEEVDFATVLSADVQHGLPWLWRLYHDEFYDFARRSCREGVHLASRDPLKMTLNVQHGRSMRYECHVDTNPISGLLYLTTHHAGEGGELVVGLDPDAANVEEVDAKCAVIHPTAGHLIFFDARTAPHYVRPLADDSAVRVVAVLNYYIDSWPESQRPPDLDAHLFGSEETLQGQLEIKTAALLGGNVSSN